MINLFNIHRIERDPIVALSGGVDSIVLLDILLKLRHQPKIAHFVHSYSDFATAEHQFVQQIANKFSLELIVQQQPDDKPKNCSIESYWRHGRLNFLSSFETPVVTGHHLDDVIEWYIFTCSTGEGHWMPFRYKNVIKPLLTTAKSAIVGYARENNLEWLEDPTNHSLERARNRIRHQILPEMLKVNPGLYTVSRKKIIERFTEPKDQPVNITPSEDTTQWQKQPY